MVNTSKHGSTAIQEYLSTSDGALAQLQNRAAQLQYYHERIKSILPPPLEDHFTLANVDKNYLTLHTDSPAWAARLRFKTPDILKCIQDSCDTNPPKSIRIKVILPTSTVKKTGSKPKLSAANAQLIHKTADSIKDPKLRNALYRLSKNCKD